MAALLFAGQDYYPGGGWCDYVASFPTVDEAKAHISALATSTDVPARVGTMGSTLEYCTGPERGTLLKVGDRINGGVVAAVNGDTATVEYPARTDTCNPYDWAHVVVDAEIVGNWTVDQDWG